MVQNNLFRLGLLCFVLVAMHMGEGVFAQSVEFRRPEAVYSSSPRGCQIERVELSEEATIVRFRQEKGKTLSLTSSCWLMDETGQRYPLRQIDESEVRQGDTVRVLSQRRFTLSFAPLPVTTRAFDFCGGQRYADLRIYGIHDHSVSLDLSPADEHVSPEALRVDLSQAGTAVLRGQVRKGVLENCLWYLYAPDVVDASGRNCNVPILIREDGSFETALQLSHPCLAILYTGWGSPYVPVRVYLQPKDTVEVWLGDTVQTTPEVVFSDNMRLRNLALHYPTTVLPGFSYRNVEEAKNLNGKMNAILEGKTDLLRLCDYLSHQYGLSALETRVLKNDVRLQHATMMLALALKSCKGQKAEDLRDVLNDYGILQSMSVEDDSYALGEMGLHARAYLGNLFSKNNNINMNKRDASFAAQVWARADSTLSFYEGKDTPRGLLAENALFQELMSSLMCKDGPCVTAEELYDLLSGKLHSPLLLSRLPEALKTVSHGMEYAHDLSGTFEYAIIDSIAGKHRGKHVFITQITEKTSFYELDNLLSDYADHKDVALVFVCNEDDMTREDFEQKVGFYLKPVQSDCYYLSRQDFTKLCVLANNFTGDFGHLAIDRKGRICDSYIPLIPEAQFRRHVRILLQNEANKSITASNQ